MKRIVVTPAGRKRYLDILYRNIVREKNDFDEWHLWINTNINEDIRYCEELSGHDWIKLIEIDGIDQVTSDNIHKFFVFAQDRDAVYVRLDDDIVYLENGFFEKFISHRLKHEHPFLVFANIINNAIVSHLHQRNGLFDNDVLCGYSCTDHLAWAESFYAEKIHRNFIGDVVAGDIDKWHTSFNRWICYFYERVSINAISWFGRDMNSLEGKVELHEELSLSSWIPERLKRPCEIYGGAIAAHFAFKPQRYLLEGTDILDLYSNLAAKGT